MALMTDAELHRRDRAHLLALVEALYARRNTLRRDESGDWRINGKHGHIYGVPEAGTFSIYVTSGSIRKWGYAKKLLSFAMVTQDGDDEGVLRLAGLPSSEQAELIRQVVGVPKRRSAASAGQLAAFRFGSRSRARSPSSVR